MGLTITQRDGMSLPFDSTSKFCITLIKVKVNVMWVYIAPNRETSMALRRGSHSFTCSFTMPASTS